jgi:hypothetical protein
MPKPPRYTALVHKSLEACIAAIEIYNKPDFRYREEAFSILMLNAWELLLKARVLKENRSKSRAIEVWVPRTNKDGSRSKRQQPRRNRSGNKMTIGVATAADLVRQYEADGIDQRCIDNLQMLMEIRDNSIHLYNVSPGLSKRIQEVGSAALKNFARAVQRWFGADLSRFNFYLMPLAFHAPAAMVESLADDRQPAATSRLLNYFAEREREHPSDEAEDFNVTLQVELRFVRTTGADAAPVRVARDPGAVPVQWDEDAILRAYPWDYETLNERLRDRYSDFVQNQRYHRLRNEIEQDERLCRIRYLDPAKPKSGKKKFYSPNILTQFDRHYTRAREAAAGPAGATIAAR